jgi:hypothetical protein
MTPCRYTSDTRRVTDTVHQNKSLVWTYKIHILQLKTAPGRATPLPTPCNGVMVFLQVRTSVITLLLKLYGIFHGRRRGGGGRVYTRPHLGKSFELDRENPGFLRK